MPASPSEAVTAAPALAYARLLRENHAMIAQGQGDSPEAEALAERMDEPWHVLSPREQARMRGLSADLYALREGGPGQVAMSQDQLQAWRQAAREVIARSETGDVDTVLDFLRQPAPSSVPRHIIRFLQARSWERLGDLETALVFMRQAEKEDPQHAVSVLTLLQRLSRRQDAAAQAERVIAPPDATASELYLAGAAFLDLSRSQEGSEGEAWLRRALATFQRAQAALAQQPDVAREFPGLDAGIACALGLCQEQLGDTAAALRAYSSAVERHPADPELLTMRGLAQYPRDIPASLRDLAHATRAGARSIWPWQILARHALLQGAYGDAMRLALRALEQPGPDAARAEAHETLALAQAMLGQPSRWIEENFDQALRLDPDNRRIRQNRDIALGQPAPSRAGRSAARFKPTESDPRTWNPSRQRRLDFERETLGDRRDARITEGFVAA